MEHNEIIKQLTSNTKCPFCGSDAWFTSEDGQFACADCNKTGGVTEYLVYKNNVSYRRAEWSQNKNTDYKKLLEINKSALEFYQSHAEKTTYFDERELSEKTKKSFKLGYSPKNFSVISFLIKKGFSKEEIAEAGFGSDYDFFKGRVMFPIYNENNTLCGFGGRVTEAGSSKAKYLNTKENALFHKGDILFGFNACKGSETIYLVEGYMDVISLHQAGLTNAVAALGTAVHERHCSLMKEYGVKTIILCLDSDAAGTTSALRVIPMLLEWFDVKVLRLNGAKDPDEYIKKYGLKSFKDISLENAAGFYCKNSEAWQSSIVDLLFKKAE